MRYNKDKALYLCILFLTVAQVAVHCAAPSRRLGLLVSMPLVGLEFALCYLGGLLLSKQPLPVAKKLGVGALTLLAAGLFHEVALRQLFILPRYSGYLPGCQNNYHELFEAVNCYCADHNEQGGGPYDSYPHSMNELIPKYLKSMPPCPSGNLEYRIVPKTPDEMLKSGFEIECVGQGHQVEGLLPNYPRYNTSGDQVLGPKVKPVIPWWWWYRWEE